ncbi:MAG: hypothetical protein IIX86_05115 [Clostridia bacterium]|nr:hypothetical protein [Clostridia bacterium]
MYEKQTHKIPLRRAEYIKQEQRLLFSQGMLFLAMAAIVTAFAAIWTAITAIVYTDTPLVFWLILLALAIALWGFAAYLVCIAIKANLPLLCLLTGKYTIEVDRVGRIELRSEKNHRHSSSLIDYLNKPDYVTYQYVCFERYGEVQTDKNAEFAQDAEYYVLVALTKTPEIIAYRSREKYELTER